MDYIYKDGNVSDFKCSLADWGTAGKHPGGTPLYAGPRTYEANSKDLFSFARLCLNLFLQREGKVNILGKKHQYFQEKMCSLQEDWFYLTFYPQENFDRLLALRNRMTPFLKAVSRALCLELEQDHVKIEERQAHYNEIMQNLPPENWSSNFCAYSSSTSESINDEFARLLNLE